MYLNALFPATRKVDLYHNVLCQALGLFHTIQKIYQAMIKGEMTLAAVVPKQLQNYLPPAEQLGPPHTLHGRRYHSDPGSSKSPTLVESNLKPRG